MLQFLPVFDGNTIAIRASGKLTHEDYQNFLPQLEEQIEALETVSVLFELDNFSGWELDAAKDDFKFGMQHRADFERIAIVGDEAWEHWMSLMAKPFLPSGKVHYFNRENLQDAWDWLREKQEIEKAADQLTKYDDIVVAVDFSPQSKHAVKRGIDLASHYHANLTLLNIVQEAVMFPNFYDDNLMIYPYDYTLLEDQNKQQLEFSNQQMKVFVESFASEVEASEGVTIKTKVLAGDTTSTILSYLEAQKSDLIVFGMIKKKGLPGLLGSTPRYIQNHARCELLVVPLQRGDTFMESKEE